LFFLNSIYQFFGYKTDIKTLSNLEKKETIDHLGTIENISAPQLNRENSLKNKHPIASMRNAPMLSFSYSNENLNKAGLELVASGMFGDIYDTNDGYLIKKSTQGAQNNFKKEVLFFNKFYGDGSATLMHQCCFKMRKISGIPLSKIANPSDFIPYEKVNDLLNALKEKGIYHGDLKPENIIWNHDNQKLLPIDFGKSCELNNDSVEQPLFGW